MKQYIDVLGKAIPEEDNIKVNKVVEESIQDHDKCIGLLDDLMGGIDTQKDDGISQSLLKTATDLKNATLHSKEIIGGTNSAVVLYGALDNFHKVRKDSALLFFRKLREIEAVFEFHNIPHERYEPKKKSKRKNSD